MENLKKLEKCLLCKCCETPQPVKKSHNEILVALDGNPNVGKSTLFNMITGMKQYVGNWPGKTVDRKEGIRRWRGKILRLIDLPGTYSLTAYSMEETIARDFILHCGPDVVVDVVDASNFERNLYLTIQILELTSKLVVALNMVDIAEARGIKIDVKKLSELLGVPVVPTVADKGRGIPELLNTIIDIAEGKLTSRGFKLHYGPKLEPLISRVESMLENVDLRGHPKRWVAVKLLEGDPEAYSLVKEAPSLLPQLLALRRG